MWDVLIFLPSGARAGGHHGVADDVGGGGEGAGGHESDAAGAEVPESSPEYEIPGSPGPGGQR